MCLDSCNSKRPVPTAPPATCATCTDKKLAVWAMGRAVPLEFDDPDARLPNPGRGSQVFGQDMWDVGFKFTTFDNLIAKLDGQFSLPPFVCGNWWQNCGPFKENQIYKLAINVHGGAGTCDIDNVKNASTANSGLDDPDMLNIKTLPKYEARLKALMYYLNHNAILYFMCCNTGAHDPGAAFLVEISKRLAPKAVHVVGFTCILYSNTGGESLGGQKKAGKNSCYPGCRETGYGMPAPKHRATDVHNSRPYEGTAWHDLNAYPWAVLGGPYHKSAAKGNIISFGREADK